MLEIPESITIASQLNDEVIRKEIKKVIVNHTPNKFAFFHKEPERYEELLLGRRIEKAQAIGGMIEIYLGDIHLVIGDGTNIRYCINEKDIPKKHQLQLIFLDNTSLVFYVQMYGSIWAFQEDTLDNPYYIAAKTKVSVLTEEFDLNYFNELLKQSKPMSFKAFLTTEQRIPGLGNGILQDILWNAKLHPKRKTHTANDFEIETLFHSMKKTIQNMVENGGRDLEKDLFGKNGRYKTILSKNTVSMPCQRCGGIVQKESYMGGSIYFCPDCQKLTLVKDANNLMESREKYS